MTGRVLIGPLSGRIAALCAAFEYQDALSVLHSYAVSSEAQAARYTIRAAFNVLALSAYFEAARCLVGGALLRGYDRHSGQCPCDCHRRGMAIDILPGCHCEAAVERIGGAARAGQLGRVRSVTARVDIGTVHVCWRSATLYAGRVVLDSGAYHR